jgi:hypothetical protein
MSHVAMDRSPCHPSHPSHLILSLMSRRATRRAARARARSLARSPTPGWHGMAWCMVHGAWYVVGHGLHLCALASSHVQAVETCLCCWRMRDAGCLRANIELNHERGVQPGWG